MLINFWKYAYKIAYALCKDRFIFLSSRPFCYASKALWFYKYNIYL